MTHKVFLSFDYERDCARAMQVSVTHPLDGRYAFSGVIDRADWLTLERGGGDAVRRWIDQGLAAAAVAVVLIGSETWSSPWVHYAIRKCRAEGRAMVGIQVHRLVIQVHRLADLRTGLCDYKGQSPFELHCVTGSKPPLFLTEVYRTFDWVADNGEKNLSAWLLDAESRPQMVTKSYPRTGTPLSEIRFKGDIGGVAASPHGGEDCSPMP